MTRAVDRSRRVRREARTVELMIRMYCHDNHSPAQSSSGGRRDRTLCPDCAALLDYSLLHLRGCRFGGAKPTCDCCPVHCFSPDMRDKIKTAMRYAGPRMTYRHPYLAVMHLVNRRRRPATPGTA